MHIAFETTFRRKHLFAPGRLGATYLVFEVSLFNMRERQREKERESNGAFPKLKNIECLGK